MFMMRLGAATPTAGDQLLLQIIGVSCVGRNIADGGEGGIIRSCSGAVLVAMHHQEPGDSGRSVLGSDDCHWRTVALGSALGAWLSRLRTRETNREDLAEIIEHLPIEQANSAARMRD